MKKLLLTSMKNLIVYIILLSNFAIAQKMENYENNLVTDNHKEEEVFTVVEQQPQFPGGIAEMMTFIKKNINYPREAANMGIEGRVIVGFEVGKDGRLDNIIVEKGLGYGCDEEAIRVVKMMPNWVSGKMNGRSVKVKMTVPIKIQLPIELPIELTTNKAIDLEYNSAFAFDVMFGNTFGSGVTCGMGLKNIINRSIGFYFLTHYFNTEESSKGTFSSTYYGYHDIESKSTERLKPYGMSLGLTYNISNLFKLHKDLGLTIHTGIGNIKKKIQTKTSTTRFYDNHYLSPTYVTSVEISEQKILSYEVLISYDLLTSINTCSSFTATLGYFSNCGVVALLGFGLNLDKMY